MSVLGECSDCSVLLKFALALTTARNYGDSGAIRAVRDDAAAMLLRRAMATQAPSGKILMTGVCGQIGSELMPFLRSIYGNENVIGSDVREPATHASRLESGPFVRLDPTDADGLNRLVTERGVGTIVCIMFMSIGTEIVFMQLHRRNDTSSERRDRVVSTKSTLERALDNLESHVRELGLEARRQKQRAKRQHGRRGHAHERRRPKKIVSRVRTMSSVHSQRRWSPRARPMPPPRTPSPTRSLRHSSTRCQS